MTPQEGISLPSYKGFDRLVAACLSHPCTAQVLIQQPFPSGDKLAQARRGAPSLHTSLELTA